MNRTNSCVTGLGAMVSRDSAVVTPYSGEVAALSARVQELQLQQTQLRADLDKERAQNGDLRADLSKWIGIVRQMDQSMLTKELEIHGRINGVTDACKSLDQRTCTLSGVYEGTSVRMTRLEARQTDFSNTFSVLTTKYSDLSKQCAVLNQAVFNPMQTTGCKAYR